MDVQSLGTDTLCDVLMVYLKEVPVSEEAVVDSLYTQKGPGKQ